MADLSALLGGEQTLDEIQGAEVPDGTWKTRIIGARFEEPRYSEKMGMDFTQVRFMLVAEEPVEVDQNELVSFEEAGGSEEAGPLFHYFGPIARARDFERLNRLLEAVGVPTKGRTPEEALDELRGGDYYVAAEVSTETDDEGEQRKRVQKIFALSD